MKKIRCRCTARVCSPTVSRRSASRRLKRRHGEIDEATEGAKNGPLPSADEIEKDTYADGHRHGGTDLPRRVASAIAQEMERDENVVFLGEDIGGAGGVFKATVGLLERFGPTRVRDTPISRWRFSVRDGAAMTGLRPIARSCFRISSRVLGYSGEPNGEGALHERRQSPLRSSCAPPTAGAYASARSIRKR